MTKPATNDLGATRLAIAALQAERQTLQGNTRDQSEARAEIAAYVARVAEPINERIRYATLGGGIGGDLLHVWPNPNGSIDLGPVLVALLGTDVLTRVLSRHVDELSPASARAERVARLAKIAVELNRLEDLEEATVCELEAQGLRPDRRADARPEIVLALRA